MENYFHTLLATPLFAGIKENELSAMLSCMDANVLVIPKNTPVFLEGDDAGFFGIVLEGSVQIVKDDFYGNRSILTYAEPGELFGEAFACGEVEKMPVSGYAAKDSKILMLSCKKMLTVCSSACSFHNRLIKNLLTVVANRNLNLSQKISVMSHKTTKEKLMAYLLEQAKKSGSTEFTIPLDRQALADYLGVERSAMSAELGKLRKAGILDTTGSRFHLLKEHPINQRFD